MFYPNNPEANTINQDELQLLHKQQIYESSPGSILKDFQMLLDFMSRDA